MRHLRLVLFDIKQTLWEQCDVRSVLLKITLEENNLELQLWWVVITISSFAHSQLQVFYTGRFVILTNYRLYSSYTREIKPIFPNTKKYKNFFSEDCFEDNIRNSGSQMMMMSNVKLAHKKQFVRKGHFNTKSILKYHCTLSDCTCSLEILQSFL